MTPGVDLARAQGRLWTLDFGGNKSLLYSGKTGRVSRATCVKSMTLLRSEIEESFESYER